MLAKGTTLGPYKILAPLGAGGMGEVYRASDSRLGRDVAIKVIPADLARDRERIKRFEQEARAAGALNHPNVCAILDIGYYEGSPFVVMELLEGDSLRARLKQGPIPARKSIDWAAQAAHGLAAAHEKGIVHRDLKPENLFLTKDGRVKVLDFGLAKLTRPEVLAPAGEEPVTVAATQTGAILGTMGYMAPEQVRGESVDHRADLFALGSILYELLAGQRAFAGATFYETSYRIVNEDPPLLSASGRDIPSGLETVVRHCLEKNPEERFQTARDLAFAIGISPGGESAATDFVSADLRPPRRHRWRLPLLALLALILVGAPVASYRWARSSGQAVVPSFERVTFRRGNVGSARFAPDGRTVVYTASWGGSAPEVFVQRLGSPDSRSLGAGRGVAGAIGNEVVILHGYPSTLAQLPVEGGRPRDVLDNVVAADWRGDGAGSLVLRQVEDHEELECPVGTVLLKTTSFGRIRTPRLSPQGDQIAFIDNPGGNTAYNGDVVLLDLSGHRRVLSKGWDDAGGLAWSPDGREIWFTAARGGIMRALHAVTPKGKERLIMRMAGSLILQDIAPDGRALLSHGQARTEIRGRMAGDAAERDLSWLDGTVIPRLSADGTQMVFEEFGEGGGFLASIYLRRADGTTPTRLGTGEPMDVSPDWTRVVARTGFSYPDNGLQIVPIGAGETRVLPRGTIKDYMWAYWHPDGKRLLIVGNEADTPPRLFVQELPDGLPRPLDQSIGTYAGGRPLSPNGRYFLARRDEQSPWTLYPLDGGQPQPVTGLIADDSPCGWSADSQFLFVVTKGGKFPAQVVRFDLHTGRREPWFELAPPDRAGVAGLYGCEVTTSGTSYAYCYERSLFDLYVVVGLK